MTARRHQNLHFSREIRPPPPNDGAKGEKSAYLSGNSTPSANCLGWRRGWYCEIMPEVRTFWPSANGLAWRKAPRSGGSNQVLLPDSEPAAKRIQIQSRS